MSIRDTRMIAKAIEQRWPIKPEYRQGIIRNLMRIIADPNSSPREITSASRALLAAEQQNQADEQHAENKTEADRDRLLAIVARINGRIGSGIIDAGGSGDAAGRDPS